MTCRLCLKDVNCDIKIFNEFGIELETAKIISKYFWFEPKYDDPISTAVCEVCWNKVSDFHSFYEEVKKAHTLLTERFSLKSDITKPKQLLPLSNENVVITKTETNQSTEGEEEPFFAKHRFSPTRIWLDDDQIKTNEPLSSIKVEPFEDEEFTTFVHLGESNMDFKDALEVHVTSTERTKSSTRITRVESNKREQVSDIHLNDKSTLSLKSKDSKGIRKRRGRPKKETISKKVVASKKKHTTQTIETRVQKEQNDETQDIDEYISEYLCLRCDVCGDELLNFAELGKHMKNVHKTERGYAICCDRKFYERAILFRHIKKHLNPEIIKCNECNKKFSDKQCLKNHLILKHQPEDAKTFICEICKKKFAKMYLLKQHREIHEEKKHDCKTCQKRFSSIHLLTLHSKRCQNNYGRMCEICAKVINGKSAFEIHVLEHQGINLPRVQCPKCGSWHKDKYCLRRHIRRHNEEGIVHLCTDCGKIAPNRSALLAHKRYVHKAERRHKCNICKKSYKRPLYLKEHMATHTGETLYNCSHCSRTFNSKSNMYSHRKKMHPNETIGRGQLENTNNITNDSLLSRNNQKDQITTDNNGETHISVSTDNREELVFKVE